MVELKKSNVITKICEHNRELRYINLLYEFSYVVVIYAEIITAIHNSIYSRRVSNRE
jgi:hypothetical protein